jgi:hypothetical protein
MSRVRLAGALVVVAAALGTSASAQTPERFTAWAVNLSNVGTGTTSQVDIVIERWSSDAERDRLVMAFKKSPDELLSALQKIRPRVGYLNVPGSLGRDLQYAREVPGEDGGRSILLATDRRIGFREAANRPRSFDYPFTLIQLQLDKNGEGEGWASVATKITWDAKKNVLELENYASQPVDLKNVKPVN